MRLFIPDVSGAKSIVICEALRGVPGIELIGGDHRGYVRRLHSRHINRVVRYADPERDPDAFIRDLQSICEKERIDRVFPVNSREYRLLLPHRASFNGRLDHLPTIEQFRKLDNKVEFSALAATLQLPVPRHYRLEDEPVTFPLVFKPAESASAKGVRYLHDRSELTRLRNTFSGSDYVLQEYIQGFGAGYSVMAINGKIIAGCGHRRRAEWPVSGGSSMVRSYYKHAGMEAVAEKVMRHLQWTGVAMFEFKIESSGNARLIEINPRWWGSLYQSIATGVNLPVISLFPDQSGTTTLREQTITYNSPWHLRSFAHYVLKRGDWKPIVYFLRHYLHAKADVSITRDPLGYLSGLLRFLS